MLVLKRSWPPTLDHNSCSWWVTLVDRNSIATIDLTIKEHWPAEKTIFLFWKKLKIPFWNKTENRPACIIKACLTVT
jgi:hypothetical protein